MFGRVIVAHRSRLGLTQEALAERAGLSARSLRELESGRVRAPRKITVGLLADAFGLQGVDREWFCRQAYEPVDAGAEPGPAGGAHRVVPAQLPADVAGFTGRDTQLSALAALLCDGDGGGVSSGAVVISAVSGTAGVGKTALAVHWAHRVAHRFPDGQLYVNLRGFDPAGAVMDPGDAVRGFLDAVGVGPDRVPAGFEAQVGLYRSLLARRRMLVVLDNARDSAQVRPLLPGSAGCLVIVTSRDQLSGLVAADAAHPFALDVLSQAESWGLLTRRLGSDRIKAEPDAVDDIIAACARLPLALVIVAARAAVHPRLSLTTLARQLCDTPGALDGAVALSPITAR